MPVLTLDKNMPYAEIHGLPGACYEQNGVKFKSDFTEAKLEDISPYIEEIPEIEDDSPPPIITVIEQQTPVSDISSGETLDTMNEKTIKLLVESYGETWPGSKQAAISLLKGKSNDLA